MGDTVQGLDSATGRWVKGGQTATNLEEAAAAMGGVDWMSWAEIKESIPPAYTEWLGRQLLASLHR